MKSRIHLISIIFVFIFANIGYSQDTSTKDKPSDSGHASPPSAFDPAAGIPGSLAVCKRDRRILGWATGYQDLVRGPQDISDPTGAKASFGTPGSALGTATSDSRDVVSLGDGGKITLTFDHPIRDGRGDDFVVFENSTITQDGKWFLELAFVEVSSDGTNFYRFPSVSQTDVATQIGPFDTMDPTKISNLAGKHQIGFGTPFDLGLLEGKPNLDLNNVKFVRIIDVIGTIDATKGSKDSLGNVINDPYPTKFESCGFDLDAVGVINWSK